MLINDAMARMLFPGRSPIGERMKAGRDSAWSEIIGVVGDVRQKRLDQPPTPEFYTTFSSMPMPFFSIVVRTTRVAASMLGATRQVVRDLDSGLAVSNLRPLTEYVSSRVGDRRVAVTVLGLFAGLTLVLGAVGVYGVASQSVVRRRKEIGVRLALGASPGEVRRQIVGESAGLIGGGLVLGLVLSGLSTRASSCATNNGERSPAC